MRRYCHVKGRRRDKLMLLAGPLVRNNTSQWPRTAAGTIRRNEFASKLDTFHIDIQQTGHCSAEQLGLWNVVAQIVVRLDTVCHNHRSVIIGSQEQVRLYCCNFECKFQLQADCPDSSAAALNRALGSPIPGNCQLIPKPCCQPLTHLSRLVFNSMKL
jgi:hypothetical protein